MTGARLSFALTAASVLLAPGAALPVTRGDDALDPGLSRRLERIESAFRDGDASSLRGCFSTAGKVRVDLRDLPDGQGSYGPGQLQVIFTRIFEEFRTRDFAFSKDQVTTSTAGSAFARGRWVRRNQPRGQETVDTLTFTLRAEGADWRISEIRSSR